MTQVELLELENEQLCKQNEDMKREIDFLRSIINSIDRMHYDACINYNQYKNIL